MTRFEKIIELLDCRLAVYRGSDSMGTNLSATDRTVVRHVLGVPNFLHSQFGPQLAEDPAGLGRVLEPSLARRAIIYTGVQTHNMHTHVQWGCGGRPYVLMVKCSVQSMF